MANPKKLLHDNLLFQISTFKFQEKVIEFLLVYSYEFDPTSAIVDIAKSWQMKPWLWSMAVTNLDDKNPLLSAVQNNLSLIKNYQQVEIQKIQKEYGIHRIQDYVTDLSIKQDTSQLGTTAEIKTRADELASKILYDYGKELYKKICDSSLEISNKKQGYEHNPLQCYQSAQALSSKSKFVYL